MIYVTKQSPHKITTCTADAECRWDWHSFETVERIANDLTAIHGKVYLPIDSGTSTHPRYDIIEAPLVGDAISSGFNGDIRPCGHIKSISNSFRVITSTDGSKFYRKKQTGVWKKGYLSLVMGHIDRTNPHF